ncbi:MAG: IS200/IS605 family transposase [Candidatus Marinimicrobia bacterium]|nr:IS200/IS605 family transposase [Candidatus Neomarinimicrobiota bacterium]
MSHSLTKLWIHGIFGTKDRRPLLVNAIRKDVHTHLYEKLEEMDCKVLIINGTSDHVHQLFLLSREVSIAQVMKSIKGETSHWINQEDLVQLKFSWQVGYGAFSVSESDVGKVERYIRTQEEHHRKMTFKEEYEQFMKLHNLEINR